MYDFDLTGFLLESNPMHLKECRIMLGLTQKRTAEKANIPLQSYQQFESGKRDIFNASFRIACQVLNALDLDIAAFNNGQYIGGEEYKKKIESLQSRSADKIETGAKWVEMNLKRIGDKKCK